jgi:hypothetical protein
MPFDAESFHKKCRDLLRDYIPWNKDLYVSGGFFPRVYHDLPMADIDLFANTDEAFEKARNEFKEAGFKLQKVRHLFNVWEAPDGQKIELIGFHKPRDLLWLHTFDFMHCMYYMTEDSAGIVNGYTLSALVEKKIMVNNSAQLYQSAYKNILSRMNKYLKLGFTVSDDELESLYNRLVQVNASNLPENVYSLNTETKKDLPPF